MNWNKHYILQDLKAHNNTLPFFRLIHLTTLSTHLKETFETSVFIEKNSVCR